MFALYHLCMMCKIIQMENNTVYLVLSYGIWGLSLPRQWYTYIWSSQCMGLRSILVVCVVMTRMYYVLLCIANFHDIRKHFTIMLAADCIRSVRIACNSTF